MPDAMKAQSEDPQGQKGRARFTARAALTMRDPSQPDEMLLQDIPLTTPPSPFRRAVAQPPPAHRGGLLKSPFPFPADSNIPTRQWSQYSRPKASGRSVVARPEPFSSPVPPRDGRRSPDRKRGLGSTPPPGKPRISVSNVETRHQKSFTLKKIVLVFLLVACSTFTIVTVRLYTKGPPSQQEAAAGGNLRNTPVWALGDLALLSAAGTGTVTVHVGQQFPLTLLGATKVKGTLWYEVEWKSLHASGIGWIPAKAVTFTSPGNVAGWASFDVLSPDLDQYLTDLGENVAAVVYDVTRQHYYTYNKDGRFITGSSIKVPIMLSFLSMTENEGRAPTADEMCLLTAMIEHSDNDAASAFFFGSPYALCGPDFESIGGANGISRYLSQIGVSGLDPDPDSWGYSTISPLTMVNLLTLLNAGKILTQQDRNLALNLMGNIESDQQVGVGDTAPNGATVAMKDGWLQAEGPDGPETGLWALNSSGIVTLGQENYIISIYTDNNNALTDGQAIAEHFCSAVASALT